MTTTGTMYGKKRWRRRLQASLRRHTRYWILIAVGLLLVAGAGTAMAAIVLTGTTTLVAPAYVDQQLQVTDAHLSGELIPGGSADLRFMVRNPNTFPARVDRVALATPLRKASPAGCTAKVAGPLTQSGGYPLPAGERITVAAGGRIDVTVRDAFTLAPGARRGCGFTVDIQVSATQATPIATTDAPAPAPAPPSRPTTTTPPAEPPTTQPPGSLSPDGEDADQDLPPVTVG